MKYCNLLNALIKTGEIEEYVPYANKLWIYYCRLVANTLRCFQGVKLEQRVFQASAVPSP